MAQFDLKNADIYLKDGTIALGAVNHSGGYASGVSTIVVDTFTSGETDGMVVGNPITFAGHATEYTLVSVTETLNAATGLVFTPALTDAVIDDEVITVGPNTLKIKVGEGNLSFDEKRNRTYIKDRGLLDTVRDGDEEPLDVKLEFQWQYITNNGVSGAAPTPVDFIKKIGPAAGFTTSAADTCEPYAVDVYIKYSPICTTEKKEIIVLQDFRYESLSYDLKQGHISVGGKCNVKEAVVTRVT